MRCVVRGRMVVLRAPRDEKKHEERDQHGEIEPRGVVPRKMIVLRGSGVARLGAPGRQRVKKEIDHEAGAHHGGEEHAR